MNRKTFIKSAALCGVALHTMMGSASAATKATKRMKHFDDLTQKVFEVGVPSKVVIVPNKKFLSKLGDGKNIVVKCYGDAGGVGPDCVEMPAISGTNPKSPDAKSAVSITELGKAKLYKNQHIPFKFENGRIEIDIVFKREDCYTFVVECRGEKKFGGSFQVYAVNSDLRELRPLKGDTHIHSTVSDGKNSPEEVGTRSLETGCDFQSLSDHRKYEGSLKLQAAFDGLPLSMKVLNAEECHESNVHVHSLFADRGVIVWISSNQEAFGEIVKKNYDALPESMDDYTRAQLAITESEIEVIHNFGGLAGFDHPYWRRRTGLSEEPVMCYLATPVLDGCFERKKFDYVEVSNSCGQDSTDLAIAKLGDLREAGIDLPIMANSDAHNIGTQGKVFTIAFAKTPNASDIRDAILNHRTVAIDSAGDDDFKHPTIFGKTRYMHFVWFLLSHYFPTHNALCADEAKVLKQILKDGRSPELMKKLSDASRAVKEHRARFFGEADKF